MELLYIHIIIFGTFIKYFSKQFLKVQAIMNYTTQLAWTGPD